MAHDDVWDPAPSLYMVKKVPKSTSTGFTLIEMLVVVGVIVVVTSVVLANNSRFGGTVLLQNLAYDIALSSRETQIYGVSVTRFQTSFTASFGIHFDVSTPASSKVYTVFADAAATGADNGHYDCVAPGTSDCEIVQATNITRGYYISEVCITGSGAEDCTNKVLDVIYKHPEPDAYIYACPTTSTCGSPGTQYQRARVVVASPRGDTMNICIDLNGQISIHAGSSCTY